jgi:DNA-directed RNA polymerase alpha subunit
MKLADCCLHVLENYIDYPMFSFECGNKSAVIVLCESNEIKRKIYIFKHENIDLVCIPPSISCTKVQISEVEEMIRNRSTDRLRYITGAKKLQVGEDIPLEFMDLTVRCYNVLTIHKCRTLADVSKMTHEQFLGLPGSGARSHDEIYAHMKHFGYTFKTQ